MKSLFLSLITLGLSIGTIAANASEDQSAFDSNGEVRFERINVPVGITQLKGAPAVSLKKISKRTKAIDTILAIGLSESEMKNLNVECGELLEVESGDREVKVSVYKLTGDSAPAHATINLSSAAATKLQVKAGDVVVVHHLENTTLPDMVNKPSFVDYSTRTSEEGSL